ncbi:formate/nitrite transporter family protein [Hoeflea sp. CAU 1731]
MSELKVAALNALKPGGIAELVRQAGAELSTGNVLMIMPMSSRLISPTALTGYWTLVYVGNFAGSVLLAISVALSGVLEKSILQE